MTDTSKELAIIEQRIPPIVEEAKKLKIKDTKTMARGAEILSQANKELDRLKESKEKITKPIEAGLKEVKDRYKPGETMLKDTITDLRGKISEYQTEQDRLIQEEEERIASRVKEGKGNLSAETASKKIAELDRPEEVVSTEAGMVKFRTDKKLEIFDETKIPREYLVPNERLILEDLKAGKEIAGTRIKEIKTPINFR